MYRSATLSLVGALLMQASAGAVYAGTCDVKEATTKLVMAHSAISRADDALKKLLSDIPNYIIGGTFFPKGGEELKNRFLERFQNADRAFDALVRTVVVARSVDCELCDLKPAYLEAAKARFPLVTKAQLIQFKSTFESIVKHEGAVVDLKRIKKEMEQANPPRDTYEVDRSILLYEGIILEERRPIQAVYAPTSPEALQFATDIGAVICINF